jgi:hypothetical protein
MARKQISAQREEIQEQGPEEPELSALSSRGATVSKADAIRAALRAGVDSPSAAEKYIKKRFGIEVSRAHFSAFKSQAKKAAGGSDGHYAASTKVDGVLDGDLLDALEKMKPLVASLGAERVKRIVDLLD